MGLEVAVDDAAAVGEAGGPQDLHDDVDRGHGVERAVLADDRLQRAPGDVLHRDVVGAVPLAAVEDADDVRVRERRRARGLALEALDELVVLGEVVVQDLDGQVPPQQLVLGEVHVGHAARAQARDDPVAAVDDGVRLDHRSRLSITSRATGAANAAPCPGTPWSVTATATRGALTGAKAMNQTLLIALPICVSAVPGLPGHGDAGDLRRGAGSFFHDLLHHPRHGARGGAFHHDRLQLGADRLHGAPFGVDDPARQVRNHQAPAVGHRGGDLGHLQGGDLEFVLADAHAPDVHLRARRRDRRREPEYSPLIDISVEG